MRIACQEVPDDELEAVVPLLLQAEESESALRWSLACLSVAVYRVDDAGSLVSGDVGRHQQLKQPYGGGKKASGAGSLRLRSPESDAPQLRTACLAPRHLGSARTKISR